MILLSALLILSSVVRPHGISSATEHMCVTGTVRDAFVDPTNPDYLFLYAQTTNRPFYAAVKTDGTQTPAEIEATFGAELSIWGRFVDFNEKAPRPYSAREFQTGYTTNITVVRSPTANPFDVPDESTLLHLSPDDISHSDARCVRGKVLAVWGDAFALVRAANGKVIDAELRLDELPRPGETIDLAGYPETNLYNLRLNRAIWRLVAPAAATNESPEAISAEAIVADKRGRPRMDMYLHGELLRVTGVVRSLPKLGPLRDVVYLEDKGVIVPIHIGAATPAVSDLQIGCTVEATGVCVMDVDVWRPNAVFPRIRSFKLVTRRPDDIRVLAYPPWLTPLRMFVIVAVLAAVIVGILLWNYTLRVKSERRGRELAREQLRRVESELKVAERTRLAVELHDSIAQNLTGVSMEIDTALRGDEPLPEDATRHMGRALQTINSCRGELRNCLWDLRNQALEQGDMNEAIRLTLRQTIGKTDLNVRFNVPRSRFSDNSAHAILRIVRELAANAVRHGKATEIKIAGSIEANVLKFSVRDNGCGFDPDTCPGVLAGHFGLQGVRERVASFEGEMQVDSTPGKGTRVSVSINVPESDEEKI